MKLKTGLSACVFLSLVAGVANAAATQPLYDITVVNDVSSDFTYGPYAVSLSEGTQPSYVSKFLKNNMFSYFDIAPHEYDFGQRMRRMFDCFDRYDANVCDGFWKDRNDGMAYDWRYDSVVYTPQAKSVADSGTVTDESDFIFTKVDANGNGIGYKVDPNTTNYVRYHEVSGVAKFDNKTFILKSPVNYVYEDHDNENMGGYATPLTFKKLDDGRILVGGYGSFDKNRSDNWFYNCYYYGNLDSYGDYRICPGFKQQATVWLIDPSSDADGSTIVGQQVTNYLDVDSDANDQTTAAIRDFVTINNNLYAVGFSATDDAYGDGYLNAQVAVYWPLTIAGNTVTFGANKEFVNVERPGNSDETNAYTWAAGVNNSGKVIINRKMAKSVNSNYPLMFGVSTISESPDADDETKTVVSTSYTVYPLENDPIRGANSVAEDINNNDFVVGWRDDRNDISPVNGGIARDYEGFLYDAVKGNAYYTNDLICHLTAEDKTDCSQNGKYYYIAWPVAINDNNVILATAFEYPSYDDWINIRNSRTVTVLLKPNDTTFITEDNRSVLNKANIVSYNRPEQNYAEEGNGGGSMNLFALIALLFSGCLLKLHVRKN